MKINKGHKSLILSSLIIATSLISVPASCWYTVTVVCQAKGYIYNRVPVNCTSGTLSATLENYRKTEQDTYMTALHAVDTTHTSGYTGSISTINMTTVSYTQVTVDPATCNVTITPGAGTDTFLCPGSAADPNSTPCSLVKAHTVAPGFHFALATL